MEAHPPGNHRLRRAYARLSGFLGLIVVDQPQINPWVTPVVDLYPLTSIEMVATAALTTTANGDFIVMTVPTGEIWHLVHLNVVKSTGTWELDELALYSVQSNYGTVLAQGIGVSTNVRYIHGPVDNWMYPGDGIRVGIVGFVGGGVLTVEARMRKCDFDPEGQD